MCEGGRKCENSSNEWERSKTWHFPMKFNSGNRTSVGDIKFISRHLHKKFFKAIFLWRTRMFIVEILFSKKNNHWVESCWKTKLKLHYENLFAKVQVKWHLKVLNWNLDDSNSMLISSSIHILARKWKKISQII